MLRAGDAAPDFVLKDQEGTGRRLSSLSGRPIVLYFYPRDNSLAFRLQARRFKEYEEEIAQHQAAVVGVSLDSADHKASVPDLAVPFYLLSDADGRVHDLYEAWRTTLFGRAPWAVRRCTYIIDSDGIIQRAYGTVNVLGHAKQVARDLDRLAAQASWGKPPKKS